MAVQGRDGQTRFTTFAVPGTSLGEGSRYASPVDITEVWAEVELGLPDGWTLQSLRCASTGLAAEQRSDEWIAVAEHPNGREARSRAADPIAALRGLPARVNDLG